MQTESTSNVRKSVLSPDGVMYGQSAVDKIGFYGTTPGTQPTSAAQAAITITSGYGTASATSGMVVLTGTYNSTLIANAIATVVAQQNAIQAALVALGLIKGG